MTRTLPPRVEATFWSLLMALGYFMLASLSLHATKGEDNIAAIWPPSGYFLALLLLMPGRARTAAIGAAAAASLAANMLCGAPFLMAAIFTFANSVEAGLAFWIVRRREGEDLSFMVPRAVASFCLAVIVASMASALIAGGGTMLAFGGIGLDFFLSWMTTVALGMLIVAPPLIMLTRLVASKALDNATMRMKIEAIAVLALAALITAVSFEQSHFPATFLPVIAVIVAAYRVGPFGAAAGMLIIAGIAAWLTGQGHGPVAAMEASVKEQVFFLQFYLLALQSMALPLAASLVVQRRLAKRLEQSNRWLVQAEAAALVGHWRVDLVRWTIHWSDQTYRIHGLEPGAQVSVRTSVEHYVEEDQPAVRAILEEAVRTGEPFEYQGRIIRADGTIRYVKSHGSIERGRGGRSVGIFGTVQDVTATVENARSLEAARSIAEEAANTDMLTGLPNRRSTLALLNRALLAAGEGRTQLAVAIFDIDHFKQINDRHGHAVGDEVIRWVGQRAKATLREEDVVGRYGGEEFVCIFQGPSARSAELVAERIRASIEKADVDAEGPAHVTISIGLAAYAADTSVEELLHRADKALYLAKREGRNRLRMAA